MIIKQPTPWPVALTLAIATVLLILATSLLHAQGQEQDQPPPQPSQDPQEKVLQKLLKGSSSKPLIITPEALDQAIVEPVQPVDPKVKLPLPVREGDFVINRIGRLVTDAQGRALFAYEADAANLSEPPLILLPCQNLELMEKEAAEEPGAKFVVTGEITVYKGQAYLLLRKAMLERDMGQF